MCRAFLAEAWLPQKAGIAALHASPHCASLFQGPLSLSFEEDPQQPPLELAVQQVSSAARSAQEKVSWVRSPVKGL